MDADLPLGANPDTLLRRDGFRLLSTRKAAIPVWHTALRCRILKRSQVPTFTEFILRAIGLGVDSADEVTRLLNLPTKLVDSIIAELLLDRYVTVNSSSGQSLLQLSPTGRTLAGTLVQERVIESTVSYLVDGLTGEPVSVQRNLLLSADDIDKDPRLVMSPETDPDLDFSPDDTARFLSVEPVRQDRESSLLSVLAVESMTKQYIAVTLLLFESETDPGDRYLRVCVDGRQDERVEALVREGGLLDSMRLADRIAEDQRRVDRLLSSDMLALRAPDASVEDALEELRKLRLASASGSDETASDTRRAKVRARLARMPVRRLPLIEAAEYTEVALLGARGGVLISASRLWPRSRREHHIGILQQMHAAGCPVTLETPSTQMMSRSDRVELEELKREFDESGFEFSQTKPAHEASFLVVDQSSATVFPGPPFPDLATLSDRLGDDRPTVIRGAQLVQAFMDNAHGPNETTRGRTAELSRGTPTSTVFSRQSR